MSRYFDDYLFHSDDPYLKQSNGKYWLTDKGKKVPKICDKCGGEVQCVIMGEPIFRCKSCHKYFGTVAFSDDELEHSGIKGQKWGVRHGPPYPLTKEVNLQVRMSTTHKKAYDARPENMGKKATKIRAEDEVKETLDSLDKKPKGVKYSLSTDLSLVNPRIKTGDYTGRVFNCQNCATAFEMRERGYDVQARRRDDGSNVGNITHSFKGGKLTSIDAGIDDDPFFKHSEDDYWTVAGKGHFNIKRWNSRRDQYYDKLDELQNASFTKLETELKSQGSGARGILVVGWPANYKDFRKRTSYFHAMNYMVDKDNKVTLYDGQIDNTGNIDRFFIDADPRELMYMRTDNLELDPSVTDMVISRKKAS